MVFSGIVLIMIVSFLAVLILMVMMLAQAVLRSGAVRFGRIFLEVRWLVCSGGKPVDSSPSRLCRSFQSAAVLRMASVSVERAIELLLKVEGRRR